MSKHLACNQDQIDLLISPRFLLFSASICIDCVRLCNREQPDNPLRIRLLSEKGETVPSSNGISLHTKPIDFQSSIEARAGTVLVLTSYEPEAACTPLVLKWIRQQYRYGVRMAYIETAAYVFAQAKLFELEPTSDVAAHYEAAPAYRELFGKYISLERLFGQEKLIYSSAGAMSTLDFVDLFILATITNA